MLIKRGDTLIEVTLAVGIFSLVAIAVVAVVNGSTTGAQTALETTLVREEIDAQAEALRFIQSSYASSLNPSFENVLSGDLASGALATVWDAIVANAHASNDVNLDKLIFNYPVQSCSSLYDTEASGLDSQKAFVINTKMLSDINLGDDDIAKNIVVNASTDAIKNKTFAEAQTYPHIIYTEIDPDETDESLLDGNSSNTAERVEGLYVVAIKDTNTVIVSGDGQIDNGSSDSSNSIPAYYDFYIRSCWYATGSETPSTISTVMRLDNPILMANTIIPDDDLTVPIYIRTSPGFTKVILNGTECTTQTACRVNNLIKGQTYPLIAEMKPYWFFDVWKNSNNQGIIGDIKQITTTYTVGNRSTILTPYAIPETYDITIVPSTGIAEVTLAGTVCRDPNGCVVNIQRGQRYPLVATVKEHYDFVTWTNTRNLGEIASNVANTSYVVGAGPTTLIATGKLQQFDCKKQYRLQNADGTYPSSYTPDGSVRVDYGSTCTYSKSMDGYVSKSTSATVTNNITLSLDLPRNTYVLTVSRNTEYIASVTGGGTYRWGVNVPITATPKTGNQFTSWSQTAGISSSFGNRNAASTTFLMPKSAATVYANGENSLGRCTDPNRCLQKSRQCDVRLMDGRDGKWYDTHSDYGLCWTSNMDIAGGTTLTPSLSNVRTNYTLPRSGSTFTKEYVEQNIGALINTGETDCDSDACYSYYTFIAACAGDGGGIDRTYSGQCSQDICPKGWHLPTRSEMSHYMYPSWERIMEGGFILAGRYCGNGSFHGAGTHGYYWTSYYAAPTMYTDGPYYAYGLEIMDNGRERGISGADNKPKQCAYSVRCVRSL
jgi:type II secretory pathway pseudopilin PulG